MQITKKKQLRNYNQMNDRKMNSEYNIIHFKDIRKDKNNRLYDGSGSRCHLDFTKITDQRIIQTL